MRIPFSRRDFLKASALAAGLTALLWSSPARAAEPAVFQPPASPRATYNFNPGWKFAFGDAAGADQPAFDDSAWASVSLPHTWNETDTYRAYISHSGGDQSEKMFGIGWYRKHFKLPAGADGQKVFLEFDGLRQAGRFFLNGQPVGKYENGVTPGRPRHHQVRQVRRPGQPPRREGGQQPGLQGRGHRHAVRMEREGFQPEFRRAQPGRHADRGRAGSTRPCRSTRICRPPASMFIREAIDLKKKTADVKVEAEVVNETGDYASITLSAVVVDADGVVRAKLDGNTSDLVAGQSEIFTASGTLTGARFWDVNDPYLYRVYSILSVNGKVVDVCETQTGFRQTEFKGGAGTGGVWLNGRFVWLTGYAQRAANDWAGLGGAYPDWMHDFTLALVRESNGNYMRWMHVAPQRADVAACDRLGIVEVCPAGDKERLVTGRQWDQRAEVMRDTMIFYRNNPSILFWEAGNTIVTPEQMVQMVALRKQLDPHGGRVMGTRDNDQADANKALTPMSEYYGVMIGQAPQTDQVAGDDIFRGYSIARRDKAPLIETEDFRDEAGRNIWDDFSPPHFGFKPKARLDRRASRRHLALELRDVLPRRRHALRQLRAQPDRQPRSRALEVVGLLLHLFHGFRRRRPPAGQLCPARERQGRRRAPAQVAVLRFARDAERAARPSHHRALELSRRHEEDHVCGGDALRPGRAVPQREIPRRGRQALQICRYVRRPDHGLRRDGRGHGHRLHLRVSRCRVRARLDQGRRHQGRKGRRAAGNPDRGRAQGHQAHAAHRAAGPAGGRQRRGPDRLRGRGRAGPPLPDG